MEPDKIIKQFSFSAIAFGALAVTVVAAPQNVVAQVGRQIQPVSMNGRNVPTIGTTPVRDLPTAAQRQDSHPPNYQTDLQNKIAALRARTATAHAGHAQHMTPQNATAPLSVNFPGFVQTPSFVAANPSDTTTSPFVGLTIDVNQDGKPDLVTFQFNGTLNVSLNPGTADFSKWAITSTNTAALTGGRSIVGAQAIDINHDGYPDIVAVDETASSALVFLNKKDGTFANPIEVSMVFSSSATERTILAADVNNDGIPDIVAVGFYFDFYTSSGQISVLVSLGKGDGTFSAPLREQDATIMGVTDLQNLGQNVLAADMNKDGKIDLVFPIAAYDLQSNPALLVTVLTGNGDGTFNNLPTSFPAGNPNPPTYEGYYIWGSDAVADINGDGNLDVIFNNGNKGIWVAYGNGDGTMSKPTEVLTQEPGTALSGQVLVGYADVTGDGILDIIGYNFGNISVYPGQKGGTFSQTPLVTLVSGIAQAQQPAPADFNGDGITDLVSLDESSYRIGFYPGSNGKFGGAPALAGGDTVADNHEIVASGDFRHHGIPDVILADSALNTNSSIIPTIELGKNDGKGNFTYSTAISQDTMTAANASNIFPVSGDFNGDGLLDLVVELNSGVGIALNNGDGTFSAPTMIPTPNLQLPCAINQVDVGDMNGDGLPDIVAAYGGCGGTTPSGIVIYLNQGGGKFSASFTPYGFYISIVKLGDLNGDGKLDLLAADASEGYGVTPYYNLYVIPGNGDGTLNLSASNFVMENTFVSSLAVADLNGDGKADIIAGVVTQVDANNFPIYDTTATYILQGNGDFTFQLPLQYDPGLYSISQAVADFNGDGRNDIALIEAQFEQYTFVPAGNFNTLVNLGGMAFADGPTVFTAGVATSGNLFTGDYNGDNSTDVITGENILFGTFTQVFLNQGGVAMTLTSSGKSVSQDTAITLTASVTPTVSSASPSGTVTFYNGSAIIGSGGVENGVATLNISNLPVGSDIITASYSGDANFNAANASTSVTVTVAPLAPAFSLGAANPATLSVQAGQTGILTMELTGNATFAGNISLSCTGAPAESTCTVSPSTVTINGTQTATISVVASTTPKNNIYSAFLFRPVGGLSLAGLLLFVLPRRRRLPKILSAVLLCVFAGTAAISLAGCSGGSNDQYSGTPAGTTTLTVVATSGNITETQQFNLTVTGNR